MIANVRAGAFAGSVDWLTEWRAMDSTMVNVPLLADEDAGVKFALSKHWAADRMTAFPPRRPLGRKWKALIASLPTRKSRRN
jgi:hypothetical protein